MQQVLTQAKHLLLDFICADMYDEEWQYIKMQEIIRRVDVPNTEFDFAAQSLLALLAVGILAENRYSSHDEDDRKATEAQQKVLVITMFLEHIETAETKAH